MNYSSTTEKEKPVRFLSPALGVIPEGLEPSTPTLKVLCSTN